MELNETSNVEWTFLLILEAPLPNPRSTASFAGHPIHPMLIPFPIAFFVGTFVGDLVYWQTNIPAWAAATPWLLGAGLVMAALAAVMGLIDVFGDQQIRQLSTTCVLSLIATLLLVFSGWKGGDFVFRGHVGVADN
jgi:uncharacterized membrane protein